MDGTVAGRWDKQPSCYFRRSVAGTGAIDGELGMRCAAEEQEAKRRTVPLELAPRVDWERAWRIWEGFQHVVGEILKRYPRLPSPPPLPQDPVTPPPPPPPPTVVDDWFAGFRAVPVLRVTKEDLLEISGGEFRRDWKEVVEEVSSPVPVELPETPLPSDCPRDRIDWPRWGVVALGVGSCFIVVVGAVYVFRWWRRKRRGLRGRRPNPGEGPGGDGPGGPGGAGRWPLRTRGLLEALDDDDDDGTGRGGDGGGGGGGGPTRLVLRRLVLLRTAEGLGIGPADQEEPALADEEDSGHGDQENLGFELTNMQQVLKVSGQSEFQNGVMTAETETYRWMASENQNDVMADETGAYRWMVTEIKNSQPYDNESDISKVVNQLSYFG
ncbi:hypothetical protein ACQ4PT_056644 [Festuca glaucescens]